MDFEKFYKEQYEMLYRFIFRVMRNHDQSKDIAQETFLNLYNYMDNNHLVRHPKAFLYRIAINLCKNNMKRMNTLRMVKNNIKHNQQKESIEKDYVKKEKRELVNHAMKRLSQRNQLLLQLYLNDLSYAEMAEITRIKPGSIGKTLSRAIDRVAQYLKEEYKSEMPNP
ncbi:RNA polymerase sigma factor [bacterium]|nr:RNA polymerase sigma factor [bacterium]RQV96623.1 MAG: RNA polymerase sigma factor [bacterium]